MRILARGSNGTLGDLFLLSHFLYNIKKTLSCDILVALPQDTRQDILDLMSCHTFLGGIITMEREKYLDDARFRAYTFRHDFKPLLYIHDIDFIRNTAFYPLNDWFKIPPGHISLPEGRYIGIQVTSSSNWVRPPIPFFDRYIGLIEASGLTPVFMGTDKDEVAFKSYYPTTAGRYMKNELCWRFGKDSIYITIANIGTMKCCLTFSSWTAYAAALQGITSLELWDYSQYQYYTGTVSRMLGSPIHYLQDRYTSEPNSHLFSDIIPHVTDLYSRIYGKDSH